MIESYILFKHLFKSSIKDDKNLIVCLHLYTHIHLYINRPTFTD